MKNNEVRQHRRLQVFSGPAVIRAAMIALSMLPAVFPQGNRGTFDLYKQFTQLQVHSRGFLLVANHVASQRSKNRRGRAAKR